PTSLLFHSTPPSTTSPLSLHDALPIFGLDADAVRAEHVAAEQRPDDADEERQPGEVADERVRLVRLAVEELPALGNLVVDLEDRDRKSTRLNSSHVKISYAVFCLKKKK